MTAAIRSGKHQGFDSVVLESDELRVVMVPELGAKIVSLQSRRFDYEWLWTDPSRPLRQPQYGDRYDRYDISGIDECFPTIGECRYPHAPFAGAALVDHGELWSRPWTTTRLDGGVQTSINGKALPYTLVRTLSLVDPATLSCRYTVTNRSTSPFAAVWSAHPLFAAHPGMRVEVDGAPDIRKEFGHGGRIGVDQPGGAGDQQRRRWPHVTGANGETNDLSTLNFPTPPATDKVVAHPLATGRITLIEPQRALRLRITFDPTSTRYLGICTNMGAWPDDGEPGRWIAIEPTDAPTDCLDQCIDQGAGETYLPGASRAWYVDYSVTAELT